MLKEDNLINRLGRTTLVVLLSSTLCLQGTMVFANPQGGQVVSGQATITHTPGYTHILQNTDRAILNWQSFNIGADERTHFQMPATTSAALNRINANNGPSKIFGRLTSNGNVFLVNPAGLLFGPSARVDVAGLVASTADITNSDFLSGHYRYRQSDVYPDSAIANYGQITAADGGLVSLVAPGVENHGVITANLGKVVLGAGTHYTLDLYGDDLIHFAVGGETKATPRDIKGTTLKNGIHHTGSIVAHGGRVNITANAAANVVENAINMQGIIQASGAMQNGGDIVLTGGKYGRVKVSGTMKSKGTAAGTKGGTIKVLGEHVALADSTLIDVSGLAGGGEILIGGNYQGLGPEINATTTTVDAGATLLANAIDSGDGGRVILWADYATEFHGNIEAKGGQYSGDGGFVEVSGKEFLTITGHADLRAPQGKQGLLFLDPGIVIIDNAPGVNVILDSFINTQLLSGDLLVSTATDGTTGPQDLTVTVNAVINWGTDFFLKLVGNNTLNINGTITNTGTTAGGDRLVLEGGTINLNSAINIAGGLLKITSTSSIIPTLLATINAYNFELQSGHWNQVGSGAIASFNVSNDFSINGNKFSRFQNGDGSNITTPYEIIDIYGLQGAATLPNTHYYALQANIDASPTANWSAGFQSIPSLSKTFDGNNYRIDSMTASNGFISNLNFGGVIKNLGMSNAMISGTGNIGGIVEYNEGTIDTVYFSGHIDGTSTSSQDIGGIASYNAGTIIRSYSRGSITKSNGSGGFLAGIAAFHSGDISLSYSTMDFPGPHASNLSVSGIAGYSYGTINNVYYSGKINISGGVLASTIAQRNAFEPVNISNAVWDTTQNPGVVPCHPGGTYTSSCSSYSGVTPLTTPQFTSSTNFPTIPSFANGFDFANDWFIFEGETRPFLRAEHNTTINNLHQLQLMEMDLNAVYGFRDNITDTAELQEASSPWAFGAGTGTGEGFVPIGITTSPYFGDIGGNNKTIDGLFINRTGTHIALIGNMGSTMQEIDNLFFTNTNITADLTGTTGGTAGIVLGNGPNMYLGDILVIGDNTLQVIIDGADNYSVGGIAGNVDQLHASFLHGDIHVSGTTTSMLFSNNNIGGLVGTTNVMMGNETLSATNLTIDNLSYVNIGGLAGTARGDIINHVTAATLIDAGTGDYRNIGGFVGKYMISSSGLGIRDSVSNTTILASGNNNNVGGIVGVIEDISSNFMPELLRVTSTTNMTIGSMATTTSANKVGGLVGRLATHTTGKITDSSSTPTITLLGNMNDTHVGGAIGFHVTGFNSTLFPLHSLIDIDATITKTAGIFDNGSVGGFLGRSESTNVPLDIDTVNTLGTITLNQASNSRIGGFIGSLGSLATVSNLNNINNDIDITVGPSTVGDYNAIGGIFGEAISLNVMNNSQNTGNILIGPTSDSLIGGITGVDRFGIYDDVHNMANITVGNGNSQSIGGFIGSGYAPFTPMTITNSSVNGIITSASGNMNSIGGFIGIGRSYLIDLSTANTTINVGEINNSSVGGFIGKGGNTGPQTISNSSATNTMTITTSLTSGMGNDIGGFFGETEVNMTSDFTNLSADTTMNIGYLMNGSVGGFIAYSDSRFGALNIDTINTLGTINLDQTNNSKIGGIIGETTNSNLFVSNVMNVNNDIGISVGPSIAGNDYSIGGLFGLVDAFNVSNANNTGNIFVGLTSNSMFSSSGGIGGITGIDSGSTYNNVHNMANVTVGDGDYQNIGGFIGASDNFIVPTTVTASSVNSSIIAGSGDNNAVGGLIGLAKELVVDASSTNTTINIGNMNSSAIGGAIGLIKDRNQNISNLSAASIINVLTTTSAGLINNIGGFIGQISGGQGTTISDASADTVIDVGYMDRGNVGGFIGQIINTGSSGSISDSYSQGSIHVDTFNLAFNQATIGGFLGDNNNQSLTINRSFSDVDLSLNTTNGYITIGGFIGISRGPVTESYSLGNIRLGTASNTLAGGFVGGVGSETILNSYSHSNINITNGNDVKLGGFVGSLSASGIIENAYSIGEVIVANPTGTNVIGAFAGELISGGAGTHGLIDTFWDMTHSSSGALLPCGFSVAPCGSDATYFADPLDVTGLVRHNMASNNDDMMDLLSYNPGNPSSSSWDISDATSASPTVWKIVDGMSYPYLAWEHPLTPHVVSGQTPNTYETVKIAFEGQLIHSISSNMSRYFYDLLENGALVQSMIDVDENKILAYTSSSNASFLTKEDAMDSLHSLKNIPFEANKVIIDGPAPIIVGYSINEMGEVQSGFTDANLNYSEIDDSGTFGRDIVLDNDISLETTANISFNIEESSLTANSVNSDISLVFGGITQLFFSNMSHLTINSASGRNVLVDFQDSLFINDILTFNLTGGDGNETFRFLDVNTLTGSTFNLAGGAGSDTQEFSIAAPVGNIYDITGSDSGVIDNIITFSSIETLTTAIDINTIRLEDGVTFGGTLNLSGSINTLDYTNHTTTPVTIDLQNSTATGLSTINGFDSIATLIGGSSPSNDRLIAPDGTTNTWDITGMNSGTLTAGLSGPVYTFSSFESATGGNDSDTFTFGNGFNFTGNIDGGTGSNALDFSASVSTVTVDVALLNNFDTITGGMALDDEIIGPSTPNIWNIGNTTSTVSGFTFDGFEIATGGPNNDTVHLAPGSLSVNEFHGGGGTDEIIAPSGNNVWTIGNTTSSVSGFTFDGTEIATGGSNDDIFNLADGSLDVMQFNGGGGTNNTLNLAMRTGPLTVSLDNFTISDVGTFSGMQTLIGGDSLDDNVIGPNAVNNWVLGDPVTVLNGTYMIEQFENFVGNNAADTFVFGPAVAGPSNIDGGGGVNTIDYTNFGAAIIVNLATLGDTIQNVTNIIGSSISGASGDTLIVPSSPGETVPWLLKSGTSNVKVGGTTFNFSQFDNFTGGQGDDYFTFIPGAPLAGNIDGQSGIDTMDFIAFGPGGKTLTLTGNGSIDGFSGLGSNFDNIDLFVCVNGPCPGTQTDELSAPLTDVIKEQDDYLNNPRIGDDTNIIVDDIYVEDDISTNIENVEIETAATPLTETTDDGFVSESDMELPEHLQEYETKFLDTYCAPRRNNDL